MKVDVKEQENDTAILIVEDLSEAEEGALLREGFRALVEETDNLKQIAILNPSVFNNNITNEKIKKIELSEKEICVLLTKGLERVLRAQFEKENL